MGILRALTEAYMRAPVIKPSVIATDVKSITAKRVALLLLFHSQPGIKTNPVVTSPRELHIHYQLIRSKGAAGSTQHDDPVLSFLGRGDLLFSRLKLILCSKYRLRFS